MLQQVPGVRHPAPHHQTKDAPPVVAVMLGRRVGEHSTEEGVVVGGVPADPLEQPLDEVAGREGVKEEDLAEVPDEFLCCR